MNRPEPEITAEPEPGRDLELAITPPTFQEVKAAITSLKNDKVPGPDLITAKMLKVGIVLSARALTDLIEKFGYEKRYQWFGLKELL